MKPMIVFKGGKREVTRLREEFKQQAVIATSENGWMDSTLTHEWVESVLGKFSFGRRLLAWDSYQCHIANDLKTLLNTYKVDQVIVPGGCTKHIQAPDVSWNKPFKAHCTEKYDEWMSTTGINRLTKAGNLKAPDRRDIIVWILAAWSLITPDMIKKSMKSCALNLAIDGSEDELITCFKKEKSCHAGADLLKCQMDIIKEPENNPFEHITEGDVADATEECMLIDEDLPEDEVVEIC